VRTIKRRQIRGEASRARSVTAQIVAMYFFVVPTIGFDLLYAFAIVRQRSCLD
jgi:hypothetical protein